MQKAGIKDNTESEIFVFLAIPGISAVSFAAGLPLCQDDCAFGNRFFLQKAGGIIVGGICFTEENDFGLGTDHGLHVNLAKKITFAGYPKITDKI
jgi:hypothetical protein